MPVLRQKVIELVVRFDHQVVENALAIDESGLDEAPIDPAVHEVVVVHPCAP